MPAPHGPYRDPEDDNPSRRRKEPPALRQIRQSLTDEKARKAFAEVFHRPPHSEAELEAFIEHYTLELYNEGLDEFPD